MADVTEVKPVQQVPSRTLIAVLWPRRRHPALRVGYLVRCGSYAVLTGPRQWTRFNPQARHFYVAVFGRQPSLPDRSCDPIEGLQFLGPYSLPDDYRYTLDPEAETRLWRQLAQSADQEDARGLEDIRQTLTEAGCTVALQRHIVEQLGATTPEALLFVNYRQMARQHPLGRLAEGGPALGLSA